MLSKVVKNDFYIKIIFIHNMKYLIYLSLLHYTHAEKIEDGSYLPLIGWIMTIGVLFEIGYEAIDRVS